MLKYVKINKNLIEFQDGLNIISCIPVQTESNTNNNIGKTTLIHILQAIYGQRKLYPIAQSLNSKIKKSKHTCLLEWCFNIENNNFIFKYDTDNTHQVSHEGIFISLEEYKYQIGLLLNNKVKIFRDNVNSDYKFIRKTSDNFFISDSFAHRNQSYVAFFLIKILFSKSLDQSTLKEIEKYFEKVAKRNSYSNIKSRYHNDIIEEIMDLDDTDSFIELDKLSKELKRYKTIASENIDYAIIQELKELGLNVDFDEIIEFHKALINDYNYIIQNKIDEVDENIKNIKNSIADVSIFDYPQSDIDIAIEVSEFLKRVDKELRSDYIGLSNNIDILLSVINTELKEINTDISKSLDGKIEADNNFSLGSIRNETLQSLKFNLKLKVTTGDANKYINALLLYAHILAKGSINIVALDTHHTSEVTPINLNKVLHHIKKIIGVKQYLVLLFDNSIDESQFSKEIIHRIGSGENTLLGYSI